MIHEPNPLEALMDRTSPKYRPKDRAAPLPGWTPDWRHCAAAAAVCWAGFAVVAALVWNGSAAPLDQAGLLFWRQGALLMPKGPVFLLEAVRDLTALGGVLLRNLVAVTGVAVLLWLGRKRAAQVLVAAVAGGWLVDAALKLLVGRSRPVIVPHLTEAGGASFPSGHSFNAAVVYVSLALAVSALAPDRGMRRTLVAGSVVLASLIGISRVWLGVHFPSDALAGLFGGCGWAFTVAAVAGRAELRNE